MKKFVFLLIFLLFFPTLVNSKDYYTYLAEYITNRISYYSKLNYKERLNVVYFWYENIEKILNEKN